MRLSEGQVWVLIIALVTMATLMKAAGPAIVGGRELPRWATGVIAMMAPALLAALVATAVFSDEQRYTVGADTVGVAAGALLLVCRVPLVLSAAVAVGLTALLRAFF
ncbi:AzlD domain-containing protein [Nocardioides sp.]|uniref:AzlD domain-containing protein n=1 Tax=Nocardioides sp. TaxID=35761 RepID=UPI002727352C|nr:AzlD domain-containing protein [Nocardioides sp.]MDO9455364.1 AzlD domain-containing protein [Nocardioides sp.]